MKKVFVFMFLAALLSFYAFSDNWKFNRGTDSNGNAVSSDIYYAYGTSNGMLSDMYIRFYVVERRSEFLFSNGYIHFGGRGYRRGSDGMACMLKIEEDDGNVVSIPSDFLMSSNYGYWECLVNLDADCVKKTAEVLRRNTYPRLVIEMPDVEPFDFGKIDCRGFVSSADCLMTGHSYRNGSCWRCGAVDNMVWLPGGKFFMGGGTDVLAPVNLDGFIISKVEVTQMQYEWVMGSNPSGFKGNPFLPVEQVSWYDAIRFCNKLSELEGLEKCYSGTGRNIRCDFKKNGYRLPTEAEWEYAACAGRAFEAPEGDDYGYLTEFAWHGGNSRGKTHEVMKKKANPFGIYDMSGNVWEWCWDWYGDALRGGANPTGPETGQARVRRGGSWFNSIENCSPSHRYCSLPSISGDHVGFRVVRSLSLL